MWDDERVFVFLPVLPDTVESVVFRVVSPDGRPFCDIPGARCHISDYTTEEELLSVQLTTLGTLSEHSVATLQRTGSGWRLQKAGGISS